MSSAALDASAVIAVAYQEPGWEVVETAILQGAAISTVNVAEVVARLSALGWPDADVRTFIETLGLDIVPFEDEQAFDTGFLQAQTRAAGLSLGDRAGLTLAHRLGLPAITADRAWAAVSIGVTVQLIR